MKLPCKIAFSLCIFLSFFGAKAQKDNDLVQFSGVVLSSDSLDQVSYVNIYIKQSGRGTVSDQHGFFSFVAKKNDVVIFSCLGFKTSAVIIPDTITKQRYCLIKLLKEDTLYLNEVVIYPWPSREMFKDAFVKLCIPDDQVRIARNNIEIAVKHAFDEGYQMDGNMNYRNYIDQKTSRLYYIGQQQPISLFNPLAWAQFLKALINGDFKKKE